MNIEFKSVFLASGIALAVSVGGDVISYRSLQENHGVRIEAIELQNAKQESQLDAIKQDVTTLIVQSNNTDKLLNKLDDSITELSKSTKVLSEFVVRLDERSRIPNKEN